MSQRVRVCASCKGAIPKKRSRYCSDLCSYHDKMQRAKKKRLNYVLDPIECFSCEKTFTPKTTRQRYCDQSCWHAEQQRRRSEKRKLTAHLPKVKQAERFLPGWQSPKFGERKVTYAAFTGSDTVERKELRSAVEDFLSNGGEITKYGDQPVSEDRCDLAWQLPESEEKKIQAELSRIWGVSDVLGY